jgi:hypothetical protein
MKSYIFVCIYVVVLGAFAYWFWEIRTNKQALRHENTEKCRLCKKIASQCSKPLQKWFYSERAKDYTLHAADGYRGKSAQEAHLAAGRSMAAYGKSPHNYSPSRALDVQFIENGEQDWTISRFRALAERAPANIEWGGYWKEFTDNPHFQEKDWKNLVKNFPNGN